ncbi:hypothetical protein [Cupriavidus necator]
MAQTLYAQFPVDEREDFEAACAKYRFIPGDFEVGANEAYPADGGPGNIAREVTVVRKATNDLQIYPAGSGTSWTVEFEQHLSQGIFGQP